VKSEMLNQARSVSHVLAGVCLVAALLSATGCEEKNSKKAALTPAEIQQRTLAQKPDRPDRLIVCGETITWEDAIASLPEESTTPPSLKEKLEKSAKETLLRQFIEMQGLAVQQRLNSRISSIVLSKRAETDLGKKMDDKLDQYADQELRRFVLEEHGGNGAEADDALQKMGMTRVAYKQWKKKQILAKYLVESKYTRDSPITYGDLVSRYEQTKDKQFLRERVLQFRLLDIDVAKVAREHPNEDPLQRAKDLRKRIDAGEDFGELAKRYSHGLRSEQGGLWPPRDPNSLAEPFDVLAKRARSMEVGQVAGPIEAPGHFFVMKVEQKQERGYRPLSEVQEEVRKDILEQRWREASNALDAEIVRQASVADTSRFVIYCLERFYTQVRERPSTP